jgi:hypothetical protein
LSQQRSDFALRIGRRRDWPNRRRSRRRNGRRTRKRAPQCGGLGPLPRFDGRCARPIKQHASLEFFTAQHDANEYRTDTIDLRSPRRGFVAERLHVARTTERSKHHIDIVR